VNVLDTFSVYALDTFSVYALDMFSVYAFYTFSVYAFDTFSVYALDTCSLCMRLTRVDDECPKHTIGRKKEKLRRQQNTPCIN